MPAGQSPVAALTNFRRVAVVCIALASSVSLAEAGGNRGTPGQPFGRRSCVHCSWIGAPRYSEPPKVPKSKQAALDGALKRLGGFLDGTTRQVLEIDADNQKQRPHVLTTAGALIFGDLHTVEQWNHVDRALHRFADLSGDDVDEVLNQAATAVYLATTDSPDAALKALRVELGRPQTSFQVLVPVAGFDMRTLREPITFGRVEFLNSENAKTRIAEATRGKPLLEDVATVIRLPALSYARVEVFAREAGGAQLAGFNEIQSTIDTLHFLTPVGRRYGYLRIGDVADLTTPSVVLGAEDVNWNGEEIERNRPVDLTTIMSTDFAVQMSALRAKTDRTEVENLVLRSMEWAGKGTKQLLPRDAFSHAATALETIAVPVGTNEVTYRLATRVALLVASNPKYREHALNMVKALYAIRSNIFHNGETAVSGLDLVMLQGFTEVAIVQTYLRSQALGIKTLAELESSYQRVALGMEPFESPLRGDWRLGFEPIGE
jgi:hypothetical protein